MRFSNSRSPAAFHKWFLKIGDSKNIISRYKTAATDAHNRPPNYVRLWLICTLIRSKNIEIVAAPNCQKNVFRASYRTRLLANNCGRLADYWRRRRVNFVNHCNRRRRRFTNHRVHSARRAHRRLCTRSRFRARRSPAERANGSRNA